MPRIPKCRRLKSPDGTPLATAGSDLRVCPDPHFEHLHGAVGSLQPEAGGHTLLSFEADPNRLIIAETQMKPSCLLVAIVCLLGPAATAAEPVGQRPYELDWAGRLEDHQPPLVDFETIEGWRVECRGAVATFERTREQQIWGSHVGKLTYRATNAAPEVRLLPPAPIAIARPFDAVTLWVYGNNWGWAPDPNTPQVRLAALFRDAQGREFSVPLYHVDWTEWYLLHRRLDPEQIERGKSGAAFMGLLVTNGKNQQDRALYFDNLAVFAERFAPLEFEPRPKRGIAKFPGQSPGANNGPGTLPFPVRVRTILPDNAVPSYTNSVEPASGEAPGGYVFTYDGSDGRLVYRYRPESGTWSDFVAEGEFLPQSGGGRAGDRAFRIRPCAGGGVLLATAGGPVSPEKAEHVGTTNAGGAVESRWRLGAAGVSVEVIYRYRIEGKSLAIEVLAPGGNLAEVRFGRAVGLTNPRLVTNPFYPADGGRPAVAVSDAANAPLFLTGNVDWYVSNGSILWAANSVATNGVVYHGGTRYVPLTNGRRNDCFERFIVTVAPRYEEVLPTIPNPPSPWRHITGTRLWRAHGAGDRAQDRRYFEEVHRYGMTQMVVTDHETMWRDGGESFTFRTKAAPGKGGDAGARDYARFMQNTLGFVYGPYNNYTDFAPVNEFWSADMVARDPQNQLQHAWMRCYAPKPARAVEYCARLAPQIQDKFRFSTAYCDVHTAVAPWHRVDYDPRAPGAGTFAAVFYAYGEIMLHQKQAWNGPVYSEGNYHCFYMGLTDGNYGQDQSYRPAENPWLVDFDLRRMHDLGCNFGMGNPDMFFASQRGWMNDTNWLDRFLAATVAFGHPGFLVMEGGLGNALRSYYMLQQLHSRYCLTNVTDIRYVSTDGRLLDTSQAVATGAFKCSQVVARYADGTIVAANGSKTERLKTHAFGRNLDLPPNGYAGWTEDGAVDVTSSDAAGHRADYAVTPAYLYVDGRGRFTRFAKAAGNGQDVCRILPDGQHEVIPFETPECGFAVSAAQAVALDKQRKELGPAEVRWARGLTYVMPVKGAFSYRLSGETPPGAVLRCDRDEVVAGERVTVRGQAAHEVAIPAEARPGDRLWFEFEGAWIDFTVVPLADLSVALDGNDLLVTACSRVRRPDGFTLRAGAFERRIDLEPNQPLSTRVSLGTPASESAEILELSLRSGPAVERREIGLRTVRAVSTLAPWPAKHTDGMSFRGQHETAEFGTSGTVVTPRAAGCGGIEKNVLFMHPPWQGGVGYCYAVFDPVHLPAAPVAVMRASLGKEDGSDPGDGILFKLVVLDDSGVESVAGQGTVTRHEWQPFEADLSRWAGKKVRLKLVTDVGTSDNSSGDWGCWADLRIESREPMLARALEPDVERLRRSAGPHAISGPRIEDLRSATNGWLHYEGKGLEGSGPYGTVALLNGVELGDMAGAHGDEINGLFSAPATMALNPAAIRSLGRRNLVTLRNPRHDCFSVRRFWIELEWSDGRRGSSDISTATYTQPSGWKYAEGILVPADQDLAVELWFPAER